jgi:Na+-driven multidrug efflux pump
MKKDNISNKADNTKDKAQENHVKMTQTPVPSLILRLSCSTIVSMLAGTTYNIVDMYFVSDLGNSAVAAVGVLFSVLAMIQAVGYTFGMGAGSRISRFLGEQKEKEAGRDALVAVLMSLIAGLILMGAGFLWQKPLVEFLGSTDTIATFALDYGFWILLTAPVMCVSYVLNNVLRAEGMPVWALVGIGSGAVLNAVLDPILVSGLELGIRGAGIATFCGQSVSLIIMLIVMLSGKSVIRFNKNTDIMDHLSQNADAKYKPTGMRVKIEQIKREDRRGLAVFKQTAIDITRTGIPSFFRQGLVCVATILLNRAARAYGDDVIAAISVSNKVFAILFAVMVGYGQGFAPVAGYNYGAKKNDRVRKAIIFTILSQVIASAVTGILVWIFASSIISLFGENAALELGVLSLRMHAVSLPFMAVCLVSGMLFQAIGEIGKAILISSTRQGIFFLPLIWLLPMCFQETGVALTQGISDVLSGVFSLPFILVAIHMCKKTGRK